MATPAPLLVAAGGALGALARHYTNTALARPEFPWNTMTVNAVGSLLMGILFAGVLIRGHGNEETRLLLAVGFLGAFTTMSAYAIEAIHYLHHGSYAKAALHALANPALSILAASVGWGIGGALAR